MEAGHAGALWSEFTPVGQEQRVIGQCRLPSRFF